MLNFKCKNCGGEFEVHTHGELVCPFCGTKHYFTDQDFKGYDEFRDSLLKFLRTSNDSVAEEGDILNYWNYAHSRSFELQGGEGSVDVTFTFQTVVDDIEVFVNKDRVIYVFPPKMRKAADLMLENVEHLSYPSADIKGLRQYLPVLDAKYDLKDFSVLLAISKPENVYPLFVFSDLHPRHVAWMISRMENLCCLLEFNELDHKHMDENNLFINPKTHEAYLYGGWWDVEKKGNHACLKELRNTAERLVGNRISEGPKMFAEFLHSKPKVPAYDDFGYWDEVIEKGFGGHNFAKFGTE